MTEGHDPRALTPSPERSPAPVIVPLWDQPPARLRPRGLDGPLRVVLLSTYDLGHQPFALAEAAARLQAVGAAVTCNDLAVEHLDEAAVAAAELIAFSIPMHTATRMAAGLVGQVRALNPAAHLCFFGLYAPMNADYLRSLGGSTILGGEVEDGLVALATRLAGGHADEAQSDDEAPLISLARTAFLPPERGGLPPLERYATLILPDGEQRVAGYTEASRGCKHQCRHCPVVPVYGGRFRVVPREIVLEDIRRQVAAGARHITFGDPDFLNGPGHALPLVRAVREQWPDLTYDVTIKVEHLLRHASALPVLRETGCLFITSAFESVDDAILARLDKGHTREDLRRVVTLTREHHLALAPTFVAFTPWTTLAGYRDLLREIAELGLIDAVQPVQLAVRLLLPAGSLLLELPDIQAVAGPFDAAALVYPWVHPNPRVDRLATEVMEAVSTAASAESSRIGLFSRVWNLAHAALGEAPPPLPILPGALTAVAPPRMSEPWFCCVEPLDLPRISV